MHISKYKPEHESDVIAAISKDADWGMFTSDDTIDTYRKSLGKSTTYVCYTDNEFCGYVRALFDEGLAVYVSELYVIPKWRKRKIGQALLERVSMDFKKFSVYAFSDEDAYYHKKGYRKMGSVFQI